MLDGNEAEQERKLLDMFAKAAAEMGEDAVPMSRHERSQKRIQEKIDELEAFNIGEKPWQLKGEVHGGARPLDSMLQEDVEFDVTTRPAPEITEETTQTLEDMIMQRVRDEAFDDVERKDDPRNLAAYRPADTIELDGEKSKQGLGDVYADEFAKQASGKTATVGLHRACWLPLAGCWVAAAPPACEPGCFRRTVRSWVWLALSLKYLAPGWVGFSELGQKLNMCAGVFVVVGLVGGGGEARGAAHRDQGSYGRARDEAERSYKLPLLAADDPERYPSRYQRSGHLARRGCVGGVFGALVLSLEPNFPAPAVFMPDFFCRAPCVVLVFSDRISGPHYLFCLQPRQQH